jgi:hypothetical protein
VTTWDTANAYSNGESERVIAKAIKKVSCQWLVVVLEGSLLTTIFSTTFHVTS